MKGGALRVRLLFAGKALILTTLVAGVGVLALHAQAQRRGDVRHRVSLSHWRVVSRPDWSRRADLREVRAASGLARRHVSLFDRAGGERVRNAILATPRVRRVLSVERRHPDRLAVTFELRRPLAAVLQGVAGAEGSAYVEVDREGVVLGSPSARRPARGGSPLRVISGAAVRAPPPGARCAADVRAALVLCAELDAFGSAVERANLALLDEVDVTNFDGRRDPLAPEIVLRAAPQDALGGARLTDCAVEWGRVAVGDRREPPNARKARHLLRALDAFPALEGLSSVRVAYADLRVVPELIDGGPADWWPPAGAPRR